MTTRISRKATALAAIFTIMLSGAFSASANAMPHPYGKGDAKTALRAHPYGKGFPALKVSGALR
jgi:hypothetical protein